MRLIHHVSKNLILNQGCSQKCHNNENILVDGNKSACQSPEDVAKFQVFFSISLLMFSIDWLIILSNRILVIFINKF